MRSGSNWVATDFHRNQSQKFYFTYTPIESNRTFRINWYMTTECNDSAARPTYYLCNNTQRLYIDGTSKISLGTSFSSRGRTVYRGFADNNSWLDRNYNGKTYFDKNGDYTGIRRYVYVMGTNWTSGSFIKSARDDGSAEFSVNGTFSWYGKTLYFSKTFYLQENRLRKKYTISYNSNVNDLLPGNKSVINMPSSQTKVYGSSIRLSALTPTISTDNYIFNKWSTVKSNSFSYPYSANTYTKNSLFDLNQNTTLYAIWDKRKYTVTVDLTSITSFNDKLNAWINTQKSNSGIVWIKDSNTKIHTTVEYGKEIYIPGTSYENSIYGKKLSVWQVKNMSSQITTSYTASNADTKISVVNNILVTPKFEPLKLTVKLVSYPKYNENSILRTVNCTYGELLKGDFTYTGVIPPGCEFVGWTTNKQNKPLNPESNLSIVSDKTFKSTYEADLYYANTLFIGPNNNINRKYMYGESKVLYPVFRFVTSFYIYTESGWKLALPYIYTESGWKPTLGHIYSDYSQWK